MTTSFASTSTSQIADAIPPPFPVHRFTVEQYFELSRLGLLGEDSNCELLEGWIVPKMVKNPLHDNTVDIILGLLTALIPTGWFIRVQNVLQTSESAPEPDFAIVRGQRGSFPNRHPQGNDAGLVIEVADSSLQVDRRKAATYAAAGVPVYWIVNLPEKCIEVYETPQRSADGTAYSPPRIIRSKDEIEIVLDRKLIGKLACGQVFPS